MNICRNKKRILLKKKLLLFRKIVLKIPKNQTKLYVQKLYIRGKKIIKRNRRYIREMDQVFE